MIHANFKNYWQLLQTDLKSAVRLIAQCVLFGLGFNDDQKINSYQNLKLFQNNCQLRQTFNCFRFARFQLCLLQNIGWLCRSGEVAFGKSQGGSESIGWSIYNFFKLDGNIIKTKQSMIFKVAFGKQIHLINSQDKLKIQQLLAALPNILKGLPSRYTLTYYDQDGDEITIKQQDDYQVLLASGLKTAKINIRETQEDFIEQTNEIVIQGDFVEIKEEEKKPELPVEEPKQSQISVLQQEIDDSLIEQKLKKLMPDIISKVKSEITEELSERSRISSKNQPIIVEEPIYYKVSEDKPQEEKDKHKNDKVVHFGVTCDSCQQKDIEGARYKCSVCSNFDFCQKCQATVEHQHPFLKIKTLKQTPVKIFTVINEDDAPSFQANGQRFDVPPQFENLLHHGFDIVRGFLGGANRQEFKNKCHAAKAEWKKCSEEWKKKHCNRGCEKKEEKVETEVKTEAKPEEKVEPKVEEKCEVKVEPKGEQNVEGSRGYDVIKGNANYLVQVFGFTFEKCLKWAQMYPYMSKEELLNFCLTQPSFYN